MNAGFFDVLHDSADDHVFAVGERVDIDLGGRFEEVVDEHRPLLRVFDRFFHVAVDGVVVVSDDHGASAEHIGGAHEHGIADAIGVGQGFFDARGGGSGRLRDVEFFQQFAETLAVFGEIDRFSGEVPMMGTPAALSGKARFSGVCPPN